MQLPYAFLADAQYAQAATGSRPTTASPSVLLRHVQAASRRIDALRGGPLYERRSETFHLPGLVYDSDGDHQWWELGLEIARLISLTAGGQTVDVGTVKQRWRQIGISTSHATPVVVTADWGPGRRGLAVSGSALTAAATSVATPSPQPDWFQEGGVFVVDDEVIVIGQVADADHALIRSRPVEHEADAVWTPVLSPEHLQEACIGMARRLAWQAANPSKTPAWSALETGYESLIEDEAGRYM